MAGPDDRVLGEIEARLRRDDPAFVRALDEGRPRSPREYRRTGAWTLLVVGVAAFALGMLLPHGLLLAAGLVASGIAGELFDPQRRDRGRCERPPRPDD
jgi:hypothetical protein